MQLKLSLQVEFILKELQKDYKFDFDYVKEYRFDLNRRWRFDFAIPNVWKVGIECEGKIWQQGRHTRGSGFIKDCEKYNQAAIQGWVVLRYTNENISQLRGDMELIFF